MGGGSATSASSARGSDIGTVMRPTPSTTQRPTLPANYNPKSPQFTLPPTHRSRATPPPLPPTHLPATIPTIVPIGGQERHAHHHNGGHANTQSNHPPVYIGTGRKWEPRPLFDPRRPTREPDIGTVSQVQQDNNQIRSNKVSTYRHAHHNGHHNGGHSHTHPPVSYQPAVSYNPPPVSYNPVSYNPSPPVYNSRSWEPRPQFEPRRPSREPDLGSVSQVQHQQNNNNNNQMRFNKVSTYTNYQVGAGVRSSVDSTLHHHRHKFVNIFLIAVYLMLYKFFTNR